jgi:hypothetical protein
MDNLICAVLVPVEMPVGLTHLDSDLCWCDPIVEADENGEHVLLHRQVILLAHSFGDGSGQASFPMSATPFRYIWRV